MGKREGRGPAGSDILGVCSLWKKSDTSWVPCSSPLRGGGGQEQDTPAELGRVAVAPCPGSAMVIAHPFYLLKVTQVISNEA